MFDSLIAGKKNNITVKNVDKNVRKENNIKVKIYFYKRMSVIKI